MPPWERPVEAQPAKMKLSPAEREQMRERLGPKRKLKPDSTTKAYARHARGFTLGGRSPMYSTAPFARHEQPRLLHSLAHICLLVTGKTGTGPKGYYFWAQQCDGLAWAVSPEIFAPGRESLDPFTAAPGAIPAGYPSHLLKTAPFTTARDAHAAKPWDAHVRGGRRGVRPANDVLRLAGTSIVIDVFPSVWTHICFFSNTIYPLWEAIYTGELRGLPPVTHLVLWQVRLLAPTYTRSTYAHIP